MKLFFILLLFKSKWIIDSGEIIIQPKKGKIIITTPEGMDVEKAVKMPA